MEDPTQGLTIPRRIQQTISNWERGRRGIDATDIPDLARALKVNVTYFYEGFEYHSNDVPLDLLMIYEAQGKVYQDLPPGKARQQYLDGLRLNAEAMRAAVGKRLTEEEAAA